MFNISKVKYCATNFFAIIQKFQNAFFYIISTLKVNTRKSKYLKVRYWAHISFINLCTRGIVIELVFAIYYSASESSSWNFQANRNWYIDEMANMHAAGAWQLVSKLFHLIFFSHIWSVTNAQRNTRDVVYFESFERLKN